VTGFCSCKTGIPYFLYISARKSRAQDRSVYSIHEDLSTELTWQSREKAINRFNQVKRGNAYVNARGIVSIASALPNNTIDATRPGS